MKYKILYQDTMTSYYLKDYFETWESANNFINDNFQDNSCYQIEKIERNEENEFKGLNSVLCDARDIKTKLEFLKLTEESKDNDNSQTTLGDCINDIIDFLESLEERNEENE